VAVAVAEATAVGVAAAAATAGVEVGKNSLCVHAVAGVYVGLCLTEVLLASLQLAFLRCLGWCGRWQDKVNNAWHTL
jgi:hypothetical protein